MTAQKAAMTLNRVWIASDFSGGGRRRAPVLELMVSFAGVEVVCEDPGSSFLLVMTRTCFCYKRLFWWEEGGGV